MRRTTILLLLISGLSLVSVAVWAQDALPDTPQSDTPLVIANPPEQLLTGMGEWQPIQLDPLSEPANLDIPFLTNSADDSCSTAAVLSVPGGDTTEVNGFTEDASDPVLSCMWGSPSRPEGYRTAWYQFVAPHNGRVKINTIGSNYDTVLTVYTGSCGSLTPAACSDDSNGFTSQATVTVHKDETYYIEVADWEAGAPIAKSLRIAVLMEPTNSLWTQDTLMPQALSRHATAVVGNDIYVIGGQTSLSNPPAISNFFQRYETDTGQWVDPTAGAEAPYYANTTAAYVDGPSDNGRIYLPSGYSGGSAYDMTHWAYDIQGSYWFERASISGTPFAWATAVAVTSPNPGYYVIGGLTTIGPPSTTLHVRNEMLFYSPATNSWLSQPAMSDARYAHTSALVNGKICVIGGIKHDGSDRVLLPNGECYASGVWTSIASMNHPRYSAGSAVRPDGKWIVFGGLDANNNTVSETELYDPATDTWAVLDISHDLGGSAILPARGWPRGGIVGNTLWAIGGNNMPNQQPLPLVEHIFLPNRSVLLPIIISSDGSDTQPDDHFGTARLITPNTPQHHNFDSSNDHYDVYYFDLPALSAITVRLSQIPSGSNYDVAVYTSNKDRKGKGDNPGNIDESIYLNNLSAGRYYVMVSREFPPGAPNTADYRIIVER